MTKREFLTGTLGAGLALNIGSAALAKTVRLHHKRFVAVTCHEDVEEWLQPDWTYRPATNTFAWRFLQRRPTLTLEVYRCRLAAWRLFRPHHYLSASINPAVDENWCVRMPSACAA